MPAPAGDTVLLPGTPPGAAEVPTTPAQRPGISTEMPRLPADMRRPMVRVEFVRAHSAATLRVDRLEPIRTAAAPASVVHAVVAGRAAVAGEQHVAAEDLGAVVAGVISHGVVVRGLTL